MILTTNFNLNEFKCHDGTPVPVELMDNVIQLAKNLQVLRNHIGVPIHINSGYRTPQYNKSVGGVPKSQHVQARAADITTQHHTPKQLYNIIEKLIAEGKMEEGGLGLYKTFVHTDVRGHRARWSKL